MSLFAKYYKEREDINTIETPKGFICYKFEHDYCYITDIYILPEFRSQKLVREFEKLVINKAKEANISKLLGSVDHNDPAFERNHKVMLANNYKEISQNQSLKIYMKEI